MNQEQEKKMGIISLTALVTGNMIGAGIFLLPSAMARLGSLSLWSWIFTTLGSLFLAFVFSRMSSLIPKTGGPYAYAQAGLGDALGFQTAYCYWINAWVGNAAIVLAGVGYLSVFFPTLNEPKTACIWSIALIWLFTWINLRGIQTASIVQIITTIMKLLPLFAIGILGWFYFDIKNLTNSVNVTNPPVSSFSILTQGAALTLWAFIGLECATVPAGSVKNPAKTIPIATILGMLIAAACYISCSVVLMGMIPNTILQTSVYPFADAAEIIFGTWGKWLFALGAAVSCLGAMNGWVLIQGQIPMAAADDRLFLKIFAHRNKKGVPSYGLIITSILISLLLLMTISPDLVKQYQFIILVATLATLISYLYTPVAEIILLNNKTFPYSKKAIVVATIAILYSLWAIIGVGTEVLGYGAVVVLSAVPLYIFVTRNR